MRNQRQAGEATNAAPLIAGSTHSIKLEELVVLEQSRSRAPGQGTGKFKAAKESAVAMFIATGLVACASAPNSGPGRALPVSSLTNNPQTSSPQASSAKATGPSKEELAAAAQNPIAAMISLPFQNNTDFGNGPENATKNTLNIQPVWPFELNKDWNVITRTILPVVYREGFIPQENNEFGFGDTSFTSFFSPKDSGSVIWGVGPNILLPTASDNSLGAGEWGAGLSGVVLITPKPWVIGALLSNTWSFEGSVNALTLQPFVNYNLPKGWYFTTAPILSANWKADSSERWLIPLGGGIGKIAKIGSQAINMQIGYYDYIESPTNGPGSQLRLQIQFLFPK